MPGVTEMRRDLDTVWADRRRMRWVDVVHTTEGCVLCLLLTSPKVAKSRAWVHSQILWV
jgi:hypothetical protein